MRLLMTALLMLGLASCGYHLRGDTQIPEHALPVYLSKDDGFHDLRRELTGQLKRNGITLAQNIENASTVITILSLNKTDSVISVDSKGRTSEVKLGVAVDVAITINNVLYQKKIRVFRDVAFNPENILSYKNEEKILYDEMYSEVSRLILLQLQSRAEQSL